LPQYSVPLSVSIRCTRKPFSSKNGTTLSLNKSDATTAFLLT